MDKVIICTYCSGYGKITFKTDEHPADSHFVTEDCPKCKGDKVLMKVTRISYEPVTGERNR